MPLGPRLLQTGQLLLPVDEFVHGDQDAGISSDGLGCAGQIKALADLRLGGKGQTLNEGLTGTEDLRHLGFDE